MCSRVRRGLLQRASCMSAELGGAHFLSSFSCMLVVSRANLPFLHVFPLFPTATRKCVCVCVCVCVCPSHSAAPFPDFLHLHFVHASTRTRHPPAFCDNLAILTVVNPFSTRRWLGTTAGTSISLSCVLMCASAPPGFVRLTFLYVTQFMELRQGLRGNFR